MTHNNGSNGRGTDGLTITERQVLETYRAFQREIPELTPDGLAQLTLAEATKRLSFTMHLMRERLGEFELLEV